MLRKWRSRRFGAVAQSSAPGHCAPDLLPILLDNVQGDNSLLTQPHQFLEPSGRIPAPSTTPSSTRLRMPTDPQGELQDYNSRIGMRKLAPGMSGKEEQ